MIIIGAVATYKFPTQYKYFIIYFSGHGDTGSIIAADDGEEFDYEEVIVQRLDKEDVSQVVKDSKIMVLIDACRGSKDPYLPKMKNQDRIPRNMMVACATKEEYSTILKKDGSVWSQRLAKTLTNKMSVVEVLKQVKTEMKAHFKEEALPQIYHEEVGNGIYLAGEFDNSTIQSTTNSGIAL